MLTKAIILAARAHHGQLDKAGQPYLFHPLRIMLQLEDETDRIIAVLHDVIEDSDWTLDGLLGEGFSEDIVSVVDSLTRREGEDYEGYIERLLGDARASRIKLLDLKDNLNLTRGWQDTDATRQRRAKYEKARQRIQEVLAGKAEGP